ncbi:MAG: Maf family protein [Candidatus Cloacimonetes bacterium]|jgi:septum formation protein|nr:Maf family protein [Candidatus Cloacimonadota bacterium]MDD2506430.1 Maf family protein [Candidatus Cloacimonadota bacterium]MDD4147922.1 Maf family protein [Candidatus Cloacimonadota bacterium]MDD4559757.1 Maf family protein [Candidatus Cloacimonadota bacterium]
MIDKILKNYKVILASASPRRKEIFALLGIECKIRISDIDEPISGEDPALQAMMHAKNKCSAILASAGSQDLVVAADTIVVLENHILGKPVDALEARSYLKSLSGKGHMVITGICIGSLEYQRFAYESTKVFFAPLNDNEIEDYILTQEPMDKAGAYGIQGFGSQFITRIEGCYFNVMGFPVRRFYETISNMKLEGKL